MGKMKKKISPKLSRLRNGKSCRTGGHRELNTGYLRWGTSLLFPLISASVS